MAGKVPVMDNAGILVRLIDRSQIAADLSPNALWGAFAVDAERGFINQVYRLSAGIADRFRYFGKKNWRTLGRSLHDVDKYLESQQPAFAIRAGDLSSTLAGITFSTKPASGGFSFINSRGITVDLPTRVEVDNKKPTIDANSGLPNSPLNWTTDSIGIRFNEYVLQDGDYFIVPETDADAEDNTMWYVDNINPNTGKVEALNTGLPLNFDNPIGDLGPRFATVQERDEYLTNHPPVDGMYIFIGPDLFAYDSNDPSGPWVPLNFAQVVQDLWGSLPISYVTHIPAGRVNTIPNPIPPNIWEKLPNAWVGTKPTVSEEIFDEDKNKTFWGISDPFTGVVSNSNIEVIPHAKMWKDVGDQVWNIRWELDTLIQANSTSVLQDDGTGHYEVFDSSNSSHTPVEDGGNLVSVESWDIITEVSANNNHLIRRDTLTDLLVESLNPIAENVWELLPNLYPANIPVNSTSTRPNPISELVWKTLSKNEYTWSKESGLPEYSILEGGTWYLKETPWDLTPDHGDKIPYQAGVTPRPGAPKRVYKEFKWLLDNYVSDTPYTAGFVDNRCRAVDLPDFNGTVSWQVSATIDQDNRSRSHIKITSNGYIQILSGEKITLSPELNPEFSYIEMPIGHFITSRWREGRRQSQIGVEPNTFENPLQLCDFFALGEGEWGNRVTITISQRNWDGSTGGAIQPWSRFQEPQLVEEGTPGAIKQDGDWYIFDGPRIFSMTVSDGVNQPESFANVSFNPQDVDGSGVSIYIENVLANSAYIGIIVNTADPDIDLTNIQVLPRRPNTDELTVNEMPYLYNENVRLCGGRVSRDRFPAPNTGGDLARSNRFQEGMQKIFDNYIIYDAFLAFNAGQEMVNEDFDMVVNDHGRVLGLTSCPMGEAFLQDRVPESTGGITGRFTCKYNQWVLGTDSDAGQAIYTSPIGWVGKIIGQNSIQGMLPYAPAGYRRGILKGAMGLSRTWSAKQRLDVVQYQWNPIKHDPTGYILWDALTAQPLKTALSNIHVILSYQAMRRGIEQTLKGFEFEFNDEGTVNVILNLLRGMADGYVSQNYAEQIVVDAQDNAYGTDQIRIRWNVRFKEVARTIVVDVIAYPSSQDISVSMAG